MEKAIDLAYKANPNYVSSKREDHGQPADFCRDFPFSLRKPIAAAGGLCVSRQRSYERSIEWDGVPPAICFASKCAAFT